MTEEEFIRRCYSDRQGCSGPLYLAVLIVAVLLLFSGCRTVEYVPVEKVKIEYKYKADTFIQKDSVHIKDSVYIHAKNDTVFYEKWHTRYVDKWHEKIVTDSFIKVDSIPVPYEIPAKLNRWERLKVDYGGYAFFSLIIIILILFAFIFKRLRRKLIV